ncbi:hypothetical protein O6H91_09G019400 [Diphasiastrum complanatum]|uniref:Uncharacterized protein n=1 Tax=Diphasiastrum complanatum TaxID=34168 RepID=A0ACC2CLT0_DIPCM|nr:hypothetical protein O6H91_09G019400 [Diphasiastrum complanatum]
MGLFYREGYQCPQLDRRAAVAQHKHVNPKPNANWITDYPTTYNTMEGVTCRGFVERSSHFYRFLLTLFTEQEGVVVDLFAGTCNLAQASMHSNRHCISLESDDSMFTSFLRELASQSISNCQFFDTTQHNTSCITFLICNCFAYIFFQESKDAGHSCTSSLVTIFLRSILGST